MSSSVIWPQLKSAALVPSLLSMAFHSMRAASTRSGMVPQDARDSSTNAFTTRANAGGKESVVEPYLVKYTRALAALCWEERRWRISQHGSSKLPIGNRWRNRARPSSMYLASCVAIWSAPVGVIYAPSRPALQVAWPQRSLLPVALGILGSDDSFSCSLTCSSALRTSA